MDDLQGVIPEMRFDPRFHDESTAARAAATAPGQMLKHYSPNAKVVLYTGPLYSVLIAIREAAERQLAAGHTLGLLVADEDRRHLQDLGSLKTLGKRTDLKAISHNLFAAMRELDAESVDLIFTRDFGRAGLGAALWDRLLRAAEGNVIEVR